VSTTYKRLGQSELLPRYIFAESLVARRRVLEIGAVASTLGQSARFLSTKGARLVVAADSNLEAVQEAQAKLATANLRFRPTVFDDFENGSFDLVMVADLAPYVRAPELLKELARLVAKNGHLMGGLRNPSGLALAHVMDPDDSDAPPTYGQLHDALSRDFAFVEVATQSPVLGYQLAFERGEGLQVDGSLAGNSEAAYYVVLAGHESVRNFDPTWVQLPPEPLAFTGGKLEDATNRARDWRERSEKLKDLLSKKSAEFTANLSLSNTLREELEAQQMHAHRLTAQIESIRENPTVIRDREDLANRVRVLESELIVARDRAIDLEARWSKLRSELDLQSKSHKDATVTALAAQEQGRLERVRREEVSALLEDNRLRLSQAHEEFSRISEAAAKERQEHGRTKNTVERLESTIASKEKEIEEARARELRLADARTEALTAMEHLQNSFGALRVQFETTRENLEAKESDRLSAVRSHEVESALRREAQTLLETESNKTQQLTAVLQDTQQRLSAQQTETASLQSDKSALELERAKLLENKAKLEAIGDDLQLSLQASLSEVAHQSEELAALLSAKESEIARARRLELDLNTLVAVQQSTQEQNEKSMASLAATIRELTEDRDLLGLLKSDLEASIGDLEKARTEDAKAILQLKASLNHALEETSKSEGSLAQVRNEFSAATLSAAQQATAFRAAIAELESKRDTAVALLSDERARFESESGSLTQALETEREKGERERLEAAHREKTLIERRELVDLERVDLERKFNSLKADGEMVSNRASDLEHTVRGLLSDLRDAEDRGRIERSDLQDLLDAARIEAQEEKTKVRKLSDQLTSAETTIAELNKRLIEQALVLAQFKDDFEASQTLLAETQQQLSRSESTGAETQQQLAQSEKTLAEARVQLEVNQRELGQRETLISAQVNELGQFAAEKSALKEHLNRAQVESKNLTSQISVSEGKTKDALNLFELAQSETADLAEKLKHSQIDLRNERIVVLGLNTTTAELTQQLESRTGELAQTTRELSDQRRDFEAEKVKWESERNTLTGTLEERAALLEESFGESSKLKIEAEHQRQSFSLVRVELEKQQQELRDVIQALEEQLSTSTQSNALQKEAFVSLQGQLDVERSNVSKLKASLVEREEELATLSRVSSENLLEAARQHEAHRRTLSAEASEVGEQLNVALSQLNEQGARTRALEVEGVALQERLGSALSDAVNEREQTRTVEKQLDAARNEISAKQNAIDSSAEKIEALKTEVVMAQKQFEAAQMQIDSAQQSQSTLAAKLEAAEERLIAVQMEAEEWAQKAASLGGALEESKRVSEMKRVELEAQFQAIQNELSRTSDQLQGEKLARELAEQQGNRQSAAQSVLRVSFEELTAVHQRLGREYAESQLEMAKLKTQLEQADSLFEVSAQEVEALKHELVQSKASAQQRGETDQSRAEALALALREVKDLTAAKETWSLASAQLEKNKEALADELQAMRFALSEKQVQLEAASLEKRDLLAARESDVDAEHQSSIARAELLARIEKLEQQYTAAVAEKAATDESNRVRLDRLSQLELALAQQKSVAQKESEERKEAVEQLALFESTQEQSVAKLFAEHQEKVRALEALVELEKSKQIATPANADFEQELASAKAARRQAEELLVLLRSKFSEAQKQLDVLKRGYSESRAESDRLKLDRERMATQIMALEQRSPDAGLKVKVATLEKELTVLRARANATATSASGLRPAASTPSGVTIPAVKKPITGSQPAISEGTRNTVSQLAPVSSSSSTGATLPTLKPVTASGVRGPSSISSVTRPALAQVKDRAAPSADMFELDVPDTEDAEELVVSADDAKKIP
jgi:golgin subfamily B member 1